MFIYKARKSLRIVSLAIKFGIFKLCQDALNNMNFNYSKGTKSM